MKVRRPCANHGWPTPNISSGTLKFLLRPRKTTVISAATLPLWLDGRMCREMECGSAFSALGNLKKEHAMNSQIKTKRCVYLIIFAITFLAATHASLGQGLESDPAVHGSTP